MRNTILRLLAVLAVLSPVCARATIVNLTATNIDNNPVSTTTIGSVTVTGAYLSGTDVFFRRPIVGYDGSGAGMFRRLFLMSDNNGGITNNPENGYNRNGVFDASVPAGFNKDPLVYSNLKTDAANEYFVFAFDANEVMAGAENPYLSLDDLRFYRGGTNDPSPLPTNVSALGNLGTMVWQMNPGSQTNFVFVDGALSSGSGTADIFIFVKKSLFTGANANDYIYMYASCGQYQYIIQGGTDMNFTDGGDEFAILDLGSVTLVPEPATIAAMLLTCAGLFWHARRRRASASRR